MRKFSAFWLNRVLIPSVIFIGERVLGWRTEGTPPDVPKYLMLTEPHTSNLDVLVMFYWACKFRVPLRFIIKQEAQHWFIIGRILAWGGALFIDRDQPLSALKTIIREARSREHFVLLIAPTGTRAYQEGWKEGFYYIAQKTKLPLLPSGPDYARKLAIVGDLLYPTGDIEADIAVLRPFYEPLVARHPEQASPVRLEPQGDDGQPLIP